MKQHTIYKYPLLITDEQILRIPANAELLAVQFQRDTLCLWALVDPSTAAVDYKIHIYGTGNPVPVNPLQPPEIHLGTVQHHGGALVWHVFWAI